ncbi:MAG TPA: tRNA (adenosine(37)-N6)-threonylcarbamoyltransferase complex ATPase subunit type 1 TsaE [Exilispira sp.]|nr:tRNA (adenosine(37)-N6)-threonylcarbamoyltransferase complex ATPase subunit type 1 TsaE [Exilispira sp.]
MEKSILISKTFYLKNLTRIANYIIEEIKIPASVILEGDLASGKTTLIKEIAHCIRIDRSKISSPTFTIVNNYRGKLKKNIIYFNHFDVYRLEDADELINLPLDYFFKGKYLNLFEWGKKFLPTIYEYSERTYFITINREDSTQNDQFRIINLSLIEGINL